MKKFLSFAIVFMMVFAFTGCGNEGAGGGEKCLVENCEEYSYKGGYCVNHCVPGNVNINFELKNETADTYLIHFQTNKIDEEYNAVAVEKYASFSDSAYIEAGKTRVDKETFDGDNDYSDYENTAVAIPEFTVDRETGLITGRALLVAGRVFYQEGAGMVNDSKDYHTQILNISYRYEFPKTAEEAKPEQKITIVWDGTSFKQV